MGKVIAEITMSLDGFVAGPGINNQQPLGRNGDMLHEWIFGKATEADKAIIDEAMKNSGAVILGNRTYSTALDAWAGASPFSAPAFVLCHTKPSKQVAGFSYVTNGIDEALAQAQQVAATKNIWIMGGASVIQQYLQAGKIDELHLHIAPILLKQGTRLFENIGEGLVTLHPQSVMATPGAIHTAFRIK